MSSSSSNSNSTADDTAESVASLLVAISLLALMCVVPAVAVVYDDAYALYAFVAYLAVAMLTFVVTHITVNACKDQQDIDAIADTAEAKSRTGR